MIDYFFLFNINGSAFSGLTKPVNYIYILSIALISRIIYRLYRKRCIRRNYNIINRKACCFRYFVHRRLTVQLLHNLFLSLSYFYIIFLNTAAYFYKTVVS